MTNAAAHSPMEESDRARDAEAVKRTLGGDLAAFDGLIERHQRRAVAVSYRLLGNLDDAMDVCQDAFVRAFRSLATLKEPQRFGAWLMRIVSNLSLNYRRGRRPALTLAAETDEGLGLEGQIPDRSPSAGGGDDAMQRAELQKAITTAVEALPEQQRLALILFAIEQMPQKEVAAILECSIEMVKWNVFQARKKLKEALAEYLEE